VTDATEGEGDSTWTRLRRRKVVQWGIAYMAGAWGLLQGIGFAADAFAWPSAIKQVALLLLLISLPIVLVLAWYHGDRGQQRLSATEIAILTLLFVLGGGLFWHYERVNEAASVAPTATSGVPATVAVDEHSIAVLPFVNMTSDEDQEYFADGISEELLNLLAQVPELRVIARTSSFAFKGEKIEIAEIAKRLRVAHVLEGSVRKSGETLRITAQLIRTADSSHLWSQTYDRQMTDIFRVQDEIAAAVVAELKIKLLAAAPKARATDPRAYALYLQARALSNQGTASSYEQSERLYAQALAIDANDAAAWAGLAEVYDRQATGGQRPIEEGYRLAREAANKALAIDPKFAPAHAELGWIALKYHGDLAAAARHYEHALALEPTNTDIIRGAGLLAMSLGRLDTAIALDEYVVARDPVSPAGHGNLGQVYLNAGRLDESIATSRTALSLSRDYAGAQYNIGVALLLKNDPAAALAAMQQDPEDWGPIGLPMAWHALGKKAESDAALAELIRTQEKEAAYNIAYVLAYLGQTDRAFEWLDKAVAYHDPGLTEIVVEPLFASIKKDPRWEPFLHKLGKAPEQLAAIKFDVGPAK
jgi:TolB-like protein